MWNMKVLVYEHENSSIVVIKRKKNTSRDNENYLINVLSRIFIVCWGKYNVPEFATG